MSNLIETLALTDRLGRSGDLYFDGNRIDLRSGNNQIRGPFEYEAHCFREISQNNGEGALFIGPGFIDNIISQKMPSLSRPDTIKLDVSSSTWKLTDLYEFKSGKNLNPLRKIKGFSLLLKTMRKHPNFLYELLQSSLKDFDFEVKEIIIPPDNEIAVTFVSPNLRRGTMFDQDSPPFRVQHMCIPRKESSLS